MRAIAATTPITIPAMAPPDNPSSSEDGAAVGSLVDSAVVWGSDVVVVIDVDVVLDVELSVVVDFIDPDLV